MQFGAGETCTSKRSTLWIAYLIYFFLAFHNLSVAAYGTDEQTALLGRFNTEIWPVLIRDREGKSCVGCHNDENPSVP